MKINRSEQQIMENWASRNSPVVSICCTTYNHEKYIGDAIDGFLMQETGFSFEIIIRDDCSTDRTATIVKTYAEKYPNIIKPVLETENQYSKGVRPMPVVFERAAGEYFALCEGDDFWTDPYKLQKQVDFLERNQDYSFIHTEADWLYDNTGEVQQDWHKKLGYHINQGDIYELLIDANIVVTCTVCVRKSHLDKYRNSDLFKKKRFKMADYPMWLYLSKISKVGYLDTSTSTRRILEESASNFTNLQSKWDFILSGHHVREACMELFPVSRNTHEKIYSKFNKSKLLYGFRLINYGMAKESYRYLSQHKKLSITDRVHLFGSLNKVTNTVCRIFAKAWRIVRRKASAKQAQ